MCAAFNVTKPTVVTWCVLYSVPLLFNPNIFRSLGGVIVADVLSRYGTSPLPVAGYVILNGGPLISGTREVPTSQNTAVISSLLSPNTTDFQNALKAFINAFVAPGNSITFEDKCAWMGSAAGMVSLIDAKHLEKKY